MSVDNNNSSYRRGVLLGLTMAEIFILTIFLLLLSFSVVLEREKKKSEAAQALVGSNGEYMERIVYIFSSQPPEMTEQMVQAIEAMPEAIKVIEQEKLSEPEETLSMTLVRGIQKLQSSKEALEGSGDAPVEQKLEMALERQKELDQEVKNLTDQKKNLITQLGRGVDWPPCWPDSNGKATDFIFTIDLTSKGIVIHDSTPSHRIDERNKLPLDNIKYDVARTMAEFRNDARPLFNWSTQKECRFYVLAVDKTAPTEKGVFQEQLLTVEGYFYKKLQVKSAKSELKAKTDKVDSGSAEGGSFWSNMLGDTPNNEKRKRAGYN